LRYQYQHLRLDALRGRWRDAERCGFDVLWNCDTAVEPDRPRRKMFDGPATLAMMAASAKASGVDWPAGERVARFGEFVELADLLWRQEVTTFHGQFYRCEEAEMVPLPVQQPRPRVTIATHGPRTLRIAAEHGHRWSS